MLTWQTKSVLKGIKQMTDNHDYEFAYSEAFTDGENDLYCPETKKAYDYGKFAGQIEAIIDFLILQGYLKVDQSRRIPFYQLTYLGMHYGQINLIQARAFALRNILVPIIVAAVTAFLTTVITLQIV